MMDFFNFSGRMSLSWHWAMSLFSGNPRKNFRVDLENYIKFRKNFLEPTFNLGYVFVPDLGVHTGADRESDICISITNYSEYIDKDFKGRLPTLTQWKKKVLIEWSKCIGFPPSYNFVDYSVSMYFVFFPTQCLDLLGQNRKRWWNSRQQIQKIFIPISEASWPKSVSVVMLTALYRTKNVYSFQAIIRFYIIELRKSEAHEKGFSYSEIAEILHRDRLKLFARYERRQPHSEQFHVPASCVRFSSPLFNRYSFIWEVEFFVKNIHCHFLLWHSNSEH